MDLSTTIHHDPKFRRLHRAHPDLIAPAFTAYVATLAESWREGERVSIRDAWPAMLPWDRAVVAALRQVNLVDQDGKVALETWDRWFGEVDRRREANRTRWREYARQHRESTRTGAMDTLSSPRGHRAESTASVPIRSVPIRSVDSPPSPHRGASSKKRRTNGTAPRDTGDSPRQVEARLNRELPERLGDIVDRARQMQQSVDDLGAGKPKPKPDQDKGVTW